MISRARRVSVAVLAALTVASACFAAEQPAGPGKGGIGATAGFSYFRLDRALGSDWFGDYSDGANSRLAFQAHWRYTMTPHLRWQIAPGFTWSAYRKKMPAPMLDLNFPSDSVKNDYLTLLLPVSVQLQYMLRHGDWLYFGGAGPGLYRVWVENHRKVLKDPETLKLHRGIYPGLSAEFGAERFFKSLPSTSMEFVLGGHLVMSKTAPQSGSVLDGLRGVTRAPGDDDFISGLNSNLMALEARVGVNYYFTPGNRKKPNGLAAPKAP